MNESVVGMEWETKRLDEVAEILDSRRVPVNAKERERRRGTVPYYGATGQVGWIDDYLFDEEIILLGEDGAPFLDSSKQKAYLVRGKSWVNNHAHVLRAQSGVPALYLKYWLDRLDYRPFVNGTTRLKLTQAEMRRIPVPLAPIRVRDEIVSEIEKQFSRLDEAVASLQRVRANLRRYRASILKSATEGTIFSDAEPQAWGRAKIGELAQIISGLTKNPKRALLARKLPYLRVANVYANELRLDDIEYIGVADREVEKLLIRRDDLLVVEGNGSPDQIGRVALWDGSIPNCVHQNHLIKVRFGAEVLPEWGLAWLLSPGGRHEIEQVTASTSGLHTLSTGKIARLPMPVPPLAMQRRIVAEVDRRFSIAREVESEVDGNLKRAINLRQATLARFFAAA